jgi:hypothetical protein
MTSLDRARTVADAVLYEGYLLYPYRATSAKNQVRWQFGVLGPDGAAADGLGEDARLATQCLLQASVGEADPEVTVHLRFLQLQLREVAEAAPGQPSRWEEAVEREVTLPPLSVGEPSVRVTFPVTVTGGQDAEPVTGNGGSPPGGVVRTRWPLAAEVRVETTRLGAYVRLSIEVRNTSPERARSKEEAIRASLIGAHLLIETTGGFVSLLDPPVEAQAAVAECRQHRCWPVLAGPPGTNDVVLVSPIILYDHPELAPESAGALFDSTEIDEILTLRVLTMTDAEKAEARATDPRAAEIIDRCEQMSPEDLQRLHGVLRDPHAVAAEASSDAIDTGLVPPEFAEAVAAVERDAETPWFDTGGQPWWDPAVDERVQPDVDAVVIDGVSVSKGSLVRLHPSRRADAQDLFFADQVARVTAVLGDVDGGLHVAVVLVDDPAADLHDWYGRYLYFAPDELEPLPVPTSSRKEHQP